MNKQKLFLVRDWEVYLNTLYVPSFQNVIPPDCQFYNLIELYMKAPFGWFHNFFNTVFVGFFNQDIFWAHFANFPDFKSNFPVEV